MVKQTEQYFLIDFDSTFIKSEGLDELAKISLKQNKNKKEILTKIKILTQKGMEGRITFEKSLNERITLLHANRDHINQVVKLLKKNISHSILRNKKFFKTYKNNIYILSGGFKEIIIPVVKSFGISENHIFANTFTFDKNGNINGIDQTNPLAHNDGKVTLLKSLQLDGDLFIIGDGYTDYTLKEKGVVKKFIAFTENIEREIVVKKADSVAPSFDEFLYSNKLPMSLSYPKNRISVLMLENINNYALTQFEKEGYSVSYYEKSLPDDELQKKMKDVSVLCLRSRTMVDNVLVNHANKLLTLGVFAIGTNNLDLSSLTQKGVAVFNAPYSNTRSVAELIIGEIIMLSRSTFEKSTLMHQKIWNKSATGSHEIRGRKLGIIGYGHIGTQVSVLAEALGMEVYFYNTSDKLAFGNAKKCESMEELLKIADIITVHVSGKPENKNLINEQAFRQMKDGVLFLNASRGFVVDVDALTANIKSGKIKGAAIDVFPQEPKKNGEQFETTLQGLPNVILTPHLGSGTEEAQSNIAQFVSQKIIDYINTGNTSLSVNMPQIQLPEQGSGHRLLHIHKNIPGILAKTNNIFAENHINILGQYLKTNDKIGYVITDVDKKYDKKVLDVLKHIPDTIRFRVLY